MRISTRRVEEIYDTCHPGGTYKAVRITEYASLAADLLDARRKIEALEREASASEAALSTLRGQARMREERESW